MYLRPASLAQSTASASALSPRTLASLISIGRLMPAITSTSRPFMAEMARLEGVPPNMSVSTATPWPLSTSAILSRISRRRSSISSSGAIAIVAICLCGPTTCSSAARNSTASRPCVTRTMPIITLPSNIRRPDPQGQAAITLLTRLHKVQDLWQRQDHGQDKGGFIQSCAPRNKRHAPKCDTGDMRREFGGRRQPLDLLLEIDDEAQHRAPLIRLLDEAEAARLEESCDRGVRGGDEAPGRSGHDHPVVGHPRRERAAQARLRQEQRRQARFA